MVSLLDALSTMIVFALEKGGDEDPRVKRALSRLEVKVENMRVKRAAVSHWGQCPRCGNQAHEVICWRCKQELPDRLRNMDLLAEDARDRREADEELLAWAIGTRKEAA